MRAGPLAVVALVAAAIGGVLALAGGKATGWLTDHETKTVLVDQPAPPIGVSQTERRTPDVKPLLGNTFRPDAIYARRSPGVVTIFSFLSAGNALQASQGSGFVVSPDGYVLTNSHVITSAGDGDTGDVTPASQVYVEFADRDRVPARIVGWDVFDDVGVLQVDPKDHPLSPVPLGNSAQVRVGEPVAAIGSPFGNENSLAVGVVSAVGRSIRSLTSEYNLIDAIQIDAPINHGNSGGPLFDARGRVIGINAQIKSDSPTGNAEGVGFAVPINSAKRSMAQLVSSGEVAYAYVGITTEDLTPSLARRFSYPALHGAVIDTVRPGTAAAKAGLRGGSRDVDVNGASFTVGGDLIVAIGGRPVRHADDLVRIVTEELRPGQVVSFEIFRGAKRLRVPMTLDRRPADPEAGR